MRLIATAAAAAVVALCAGGAAAQTTQNATATASLKNAQGKDVGQVMLMQKPGGVVVRGELQGLPPGWHAIHIHAAGKCEPDFAAAGGHFNPNSVKHGLTGNQPHAGDLPNIFADQQGNAKFEAFTHGVSTADGANSLFGGNGTSIVVHAGPDDYVTDPAGASGDRIACGVVKKG